MEILRYKLNISSIGEEQKIVSLCNQEKMIHQWNLDSSQGETILTISGNEVDPQQMINLLQKAGIEAAFIQVFGAGGSGL